MVYERLINVEEAKGLIDNFIWWSKIIHAFRNKIQRKVLPEALRNRTIALRENKIDEKLHVDKFAKYEIKGKLTTILGS